MTAVAPDLLRARTGVGWLWELAGDTRALPLEAWRAEPDSIQWVKSFLARHPNGFPADEMEENYTVEMRTSRLRIGDEGMSYVG
jgi:hypothetical protein